MGGLRTNRVLCSLRQVLESENIDFTVKLGRKHPSVAFQIGGRHVRCAFPASTSDQRSHLAARTHIRRIIRELRQEQHHVD